MDLDDISSCRHILSHVSQKCYIWIVAILAAIGNISVFVKNRELAKNKATIITAYLMTNLAASDFLMAIYLLIILIADLYYNDLRFGLNSETWLGSPFCLFACGINILSSVTSVFIMVVISIDRYICIVHPFSNRNLTLKRVRITMFSIWFCTCIFTITPIMMSLGQPGYRRYYTYSSICLANNFQILYYKIWMISYLTFIAIAWIIMVSFYTSIFISLRKSRHKTHLSATLRNNKIVSIRLSIILLSDLICWLPYYYVTLLGLFSTDGRIDVISLQFVGIFALPINSAINPFIYTVTQFSTLKKLFCIQYRIYPNN